MIMLIPSFKNGVRGLKWLKSKVLNGHTSYVG